MLVHYFLTDPAGYSLDSARYWLAEKGGLGDYFQIVNTYIGEGNSLEAQSTLDTIPVLLSLSSEELREYVYFDSLKTIQINAINAEQTESQTVAQNQGVLTGIADSTAYLASGEAIALLNLHIGETYPPEAYLPEILSGQEGYIKPPDQSTIGSFVHSGYSITAFPNPTNGLTEFQFELPKEEHKGKIVITSADGRLVKEIGINNSKGVLVWDSNVEEMGIYFYSLWVNGKKIATKRLAVIK